MSEDQGSHQEQPQVAGDQKPAEGDFLRKAAEAMVTASDAIKSGAGDAKTAAAKVYPATQRIFSKSVYATCYYLSYGVVFSSLLVAGLVPKQTPIYFGFVDGAAAANDSIKKMTSQRAAAKANTQKASLEVNGMSAAAAPA